MPPDPMPHAHQAAVLYPSAPAPGPLQAAAARRSSCVPTLQLPPPWRCWWQLSATSRHATFTPQRKSCWPQPWAPPCSRRRCWATRAGLWAAAQQARRAQARRQRPKWWRPDLAETELVLRQCANGERIAVGCPLSPTSRLQGQSRSAGLQSGFATGGGAIALPR